MAEQRTIEDLIAELDTDVAHGLTAAEAAARLARDGANELAEAARPSLAKRFLHQLRDPMIYILLAAMVVSIALGEWGDAVIIVTVVALNAIIGVVQEAKAERSLDALRQLSSPVAVVRRDGQTLQVPARELVRGDLVLLDAGRVVPADLRLVTTASLTIDESALTGESVPAEKDALAQPPADAPLGDQVNRAWLSTAVAYGRGEGLVVATGMATEVGKIAALISQAGSETTPLQARLADLGKLLGVATLVICGVLFGVALLEHRDPFEMLMTAIALAVAAVPEGLPAVVTIVLALGVTRMVRVNTIVRRLPAVETLGAVSVVCSDKTGTLTQNKMTVTRLYTSGALRDLDHVAAGPTEAERTLTSGLVLCTDAVAEGTQRSGDPTELALLDLGQRLGLAKSALEAERPRINEAPFDSVRKMMTTVHAAPDGAHVSYTKGAPGEVLGRCTQIVVEGGVAPLDQARLADCLAQAQALGGQALRTLGLAYRADNPQAEEQELIFVGLVGMIDPPRPEAAEAVRVFKQAGVTTVMITGDHRDTAVAIARELGIAEGPEQAIAGAELAALSQEELNRRAPGLRVYARVSPETKVAIVEAYRANGQIVSMTGDGVNDAPSLKAADIGVAMGITGTDVAKSAADMVLTDDNFASIRAAIEEGRNIYRNIRKSVIFLLSSNLGEVVTMLLAIIANLAPPLRPTHILWVNLITDSLPALALGADTGDPTAMQRPPRDPKESLFARGGLNMVIGYGVVIALASLAAYLYPPLLALAQQGADLSYASVRDLLNSDAALYARAQTYAFTVLAISQLFNALGMRDRRRSVFVQKLFENRLLVASWVIGLVLQGLVTEVPAVQGLFGTTSLSAREWLSLLGVASAPLWVHELAVLTRRLLRRTD